MNEIAIYIINKYINK